MAEIGARIDGILKAQGMAQGSVGERLVALNKRPDQLYPNTDPGREALLEQLRSQVAAMTRRLPEQFAVLPKAPVEIRRVPEAIQAGAPGGYYQSASLDGARPAIYYINLRDTFDRPKFGLATLTYHEAVPGHHLQVMSALESQDIPLIRRRGFYSGYSEGWALYSEQLADEMGMYEGNPLGQVGYLQSLLSARPASSWIRGCTPSAGAARRRPTISSPPRHRARAQSGRDRPLYRLAGSGVQLQDRAHRLDPPAR